MKENEHRKKKSKQSMVGGAPLSDYVKTHLIENMAAKAIVFSVLCYLDDEAVGLVNCIEGFSTFACKPVVNIHDVVVSAAHRGKGLNAKMFEVVEQIARDKGACKLTLEVLEGNKPAQQAYLKAGFSDYELDPEMGKALFWEKKLK